MKLNSIFAVAALAKLSLANPIENQISRAEAAQVAQTAHDIDLQVIAANECKAQSCVLADTSGSSGLTPKLRAEGANDDDIKCIVKYNPLVGELLKENSSAIQNVTKQDTGVSSQLFGWLNNIWKPLIPNGETDKGDYTGACTKNILIISKGTMEPTEYGVTVGPVLKTGWDKTWTVVPVKYDPSVPGDYCVGLPGGMVAKDMINKAATKCPQSWQFLAGYSQGAMVVRNGVAYAEPSAKARVKGVVTFGDPFQGAPIKGYTGPIKTFCKIDDGVCGGNFELSAAHLSYPFDISISEAKAELKKWAAATQ
ncbi:alpha/beta-hydrolase [Tothia fuscella]|uniref:cutinase n=1 Tax=Tothia fuscella TaxID=1048955 RepID=A0A9P4NDJ7_9PEZI|nr:alpha/beta-hydrolase [Tothia fuscella]